jgi:hypothetical protein
MDSQELLAQLADIHLPEAVTYWPPAPGWWILSLAILVAAIYLGRHYQQVRTQQKILQYALAELDQCYQQYTMAENKADSEPKLRFVNQFNSVLRRVALWHYPDSNAASLGGDAWVAFIREKGNSSHLDTEMADALSKGRFQLECNVDINAMKTLGQEWVSSLYMSNPAATSQQRLDS